VDGHGNEQLCARRRCHCYELRQPESYWSYDSLPAVYIQYDTVDLDACTELMYTCCCRAVNCHTAGEEINNWQVLCQLAMPDYCSLSQTYKLSLHAFRVSNCSSSDGRRVGELEAIETTKSP
jgi:hypothetical protein